VLTVVVSPAVARSIDQHAQDRLHYRWIPIGNMEADLDQPVNGGDDLRRRQEERHPRPQAGGDHAEAENGEVDERILQHRLHAEGGGLRAR
jgi:hypothetical protein